MTKLLRIDAVLERRGDRRTNLYNDIAKKLCTEPVKIGRSAFWPEDEIEALIRARIAGASEARMRALVRELMRQRKEMAPQTVQFSHDHDEPEPDPEPDLVSS